MASRPDPETTRDLVRLARDVRYEALDSEVRASLTLLLRDGLAALCVGLRHPSIRLIAAHVQALECRPVTPIYGAGFSTAPQEAAFLFGSAIHALDFEPMFHPPTHAVSPALGALLALAHEAETAETDRSGQRFLEALAAGIQLQADLRTGASRGDQVATRTQRHFPFQRHGFHPPGTVGVLGSALAAALWLELTPRQMRTALGLAASRAAGIAGNIGTMTKASHCGNAARAGVESALLARRGFTASESTLEEPSGWGYVFGGDDFDRKRLLEGMGALDCFASPGFAIKRWPAHTAMQVAIDAALPLHRPDAPLPGLVHVEAPVFEYCDRPSPRDGDDARFSFQFNVAQALLDGEVSASSFHAARVRRPELRALTERVRLELRSDIPADFRHMRVKIRLDDGRSSSSDRWPGHWKSPASESQVREKFLACAAELYTPQDARAIDDAALALGRNPELSELLAALENVRRESPTPDGTPPPSGAP